MPEFPIPSPLNFTSFPNPRGATAPPFPPVRYAYASSPLLSSITPSFFHSKLKKNFSISQILPSIDIWHLFGLISRIPGLHYGFLLCFSFFLFFSYRYFLQFKFFCLRSLISPITVCFLILIFYFLSSI